MHPRLPVLSLSVLLPGEHGRGHELPGPPGLEDRVAEAHGQGTQQQEDRLAIHTHNVLLPV